MWVLRWHPGTEDTVLMADILDDLDRAQPGWVEGEWRPVLLDGRPFVQVVAR